MTNVLVLMLQRNHRLAWFWHSWKHTGKSRIEFKCPTYRSKSFWSTGHNIIRRNLVAVTKTKPRKTTKKKPITKQTKKHVWTYQNFSLEMRHILPDTKLQIVAWIHLEVFGFPKKPLNTGFFVCFFCIVSCSCCCCVFFCS